MGEERRYNDRLLNTVLRHHDPEGWGADQQRSRVPPHVRRALYAEWDAEQAEENKRARERLTAKLQQMHERMNAGKAEWWEAEEGDEG